MMKATRLANGNVLVPSTMIVNGEVLIGLKEVKPGSDDYTEWFGPAPVLQTKRQTSKQPWFSRIFSHGHTVGRA